jgi:type IV secretory pathway VirB10-like protein
MLSNKWTFAALAGACVAAAATGSYVATRQNAVETPVAIAAAPSLPADAPAAGEAVQETEAVIEEPAAAVSNQVAPSRPPAASTSRPPAQPRRQTPSAPESAAGGNRQNLPALDRSWPRDSQDAAASPSPTAPPDAGRSRSTLPAREGIEGFPRPAEEAASPEPAATSPAPEPPQTVYQELVVSSNSVIGLQLESRVSSETAQVEDTVEARVSRDVKVGDAIAIPAGARAIGSVIQVERGGKFKEQARLGIRFTTLVLADGTRLPMSTETIHREGEAPGNSSAAKIGGGAVGGAILGAILGGAKGAAIGASAGAGGGAAAVTAGDRSEVMLAAGSPLTVRLLTPLAVTVEMQ